MSVGPLPDEQAASLLEEFRTYDRSVDVVSSWEMIFTESETALPAHVRHFERFPSVAAADGNPATPDFSVLFDDDRGLVGEIATFSLRNESVDALCRQIQRYDELRQLPAGGGALAAVEQVDVMLFVPIDLGTDAVRRLLRERFANPEHFYKPGAPPIVVQFVLQPEHERYVFQRRPDEENGRFRDEGRQEDARLSVWFDRNDVKTRPEHFREIKAARGFVNDPVPDLYLATFLWSKTFADQAGESGEGRPVRLEVTPSVLAGRLRDEYGMVRAADVERALALLTRAKLAERAPEGWIAFWTELPKGPHGHDLAETLARRAVRPPRRSTADIFREASGTATESQGQQTSIFDL